jgi:transcriptional regulator with XRE-family HTH domain
MQNHLSSAYFKKVGEKMKIDNEKLEIAMANECMLCKELCSKAGIGESTLRQIKAGMRNPTPATVGKIARALGVKVQEIIVEE